jgi:hypothetical protein
MAYANKLYVTYCMYATIQFFQNALAYFAMAVSYVSKMFTKFTPPWANII